MFANRVRVRNSRRMIALASAAVIGAVCSQTLADSPPYGIFFDLRLADGGGKVAQVTAPGDVVVMNLYAFVTGANADPSDDGFQSSMGSFVSSNGGLLGDLLGLPPRSPFSAAGSTIGEQHDIDGDGDLDVGWKPGYDSSFYYAVRAAQPVSPTSGSCYIGQVSFTLTGAVNASTDVNYVPRSRLYGPSTSSAGALALIDGTSMDGGSPYVHIGQPVTISYIGPMIDPGQTQYLSGTISGHISVSGAVRPAAGTTLILTKGLDVAAGGDFDTRDAQGNYGDHEVCVDDTTSGNAGGTLNVGRMYIGHSGTGVFTQAGGFTHLSADLGDTANVVVGKSPDGSGTLDCAGGTLIARKVIVGSSRSTGLLRVTGGNATIDDLDIGMANCASAILEVDGTGSLSVTNEARIGSTGTGLFRQKGGSSSFGWLKIGSASNGGNGVVEISGGSISARIANVGFDGLGSVRQTGGRVSSGGIHIGARIPGAVCAYTLDGGEMDIGAMDVGYFGSAVFQQNGGTLTSSGTIAVGAIGAAAGRIELRGGQFYTKREFVGRDTSSGEFLQTGGDHTADRLEIRQTGRFTYSGGTLRVNDHFKLDGTFDFAGSAVTLAFGSNCFADFSQGTILNSSAASIIAGENSLITFRTGFDPYARFASIQTKGLIHFAGEELVIPPAKDVSGSGTIQGDVVNKGTLDPGPTPGQITIDGGFQQDTTGELRIQIGGSNPDQRDLVTISDTAKLDGVLKVDVALDYTPSYGEIIPILTADSIEGAFANGFQLVTARGTFDVLYTANSVALTHFVPIPEPSAAAFLLLPALLLRRRRTA